jgi:hypothetical protein
MIFGKSLVLTSEGQLARLRFFVVFFSFSRQMPEQFLDYTTSASFQVLSDSPLTF